MLPSEVDEVRAIVIDASQHVFPSLSLSAEDGDSLRKPDGQLAAFMGFTGRLMRGTLTVVAPQTFIAKTYPLPAKQGFEWELAMYDWAGEIANRVLGRIKNQLAARGVEVEPSTPRVMLADQLQMLPSGRGCVCALRFTDGDSDVGIWFEAIDGGADRLFHAPVQDESPPEGDVLLF